MSFFSALYQLLIGPLELLFDILYALSFRILANEGLSIIVLSLGMNFLVLPLYRQADAMQAEERELEQRLQPWVKHIKKTFSGEERFMMLQTYYRQNNYKPAYALKGSLSLLLEIPFFIAAYRFLSGLQMLQGVSFGPIRDLGAPDGLLFGVNLLPILMTAFNFVSGAIYTRGMPLKSKLQLYGMALIFLFFLYDSPAGLVFYWTLNNVFSLVKNIFYKLKNPRLVLSGLFSAVSAALLALVLFIRPMDTPRHQLYTIVLLLLLQLPLVLTLLQRRRGRALPAPEITRTDRRIFLLGCLFLTLLLGLLIPSAVIASSPAEFINIYTFRSPLGYVLASLLLAAGTFLVWMGVFFTLSGPWGKRFMELGVWLGSGCALVNYMCFGRDLGILSSMLQFEKILAFSGRQMLLNLLVLLLAAALLFLLWKKKRELARFALLVAGIAILCMGSWNLIRTQGQVSQLRQIVMAQNPQQQGETLSRLRDEPNIPLSKNGKNVVVIMLDRAINGYVPFLFHEKPELKEQFSGFVYYPNTISFGYYTNLGAPALFGGYEYTPVEMNRRDKELLRDKHDEALKVMPTLFDEAGYQVTVCDPPYAGYQWIPDFSIYDDHPEIQTYVMKGRYVDDPQVAEQKITRQLNRNFFCYSLVKTLPLAIQPMLYDQGTYSESNANAAPPYQTRTGLSQAVGVNSAFLNAYSVLQKLPQITRYEDGEKGTFLMMANDATHEPMLLQEPDYVPAETVDNREYDAANPLRCTDDGRAISLDTENQITHYQVNMASLLALGRWFDELRENGVYDNTRIILVADHGRDLDRLLPELCFFDGALDAMEANPLLLVKDFGASGPPVTDTRLMTNADVPVLATRDLIRDPVNPFTGKPLNADAKNAPELYISTSYDWDVLINNGTTFLPAPWVSVHDDIFREENWRINVTPPEN